MFVLGFTAAISLTLSASAQSILIDDFNDGNDDGWTGVDPVPGEPWDPAIFDASSGAYNLRSTGVVPAYRWVAFHSQWDASVDSFYSEGFLRAEIRANRQNTAVWFVMRAGDPPENREGYLFYADTADGRFSLRCSPNCSSVYYVDEAAPVDPFDPNEPWVMEAGAVSDQISLKLWRLDDPEPDEPQLTITDTTYTAGVFIVGVSHNPGVASQISGTFDNIYFTPACPGDLDGDLDVDLSDLAQLLGNYGTSSGASYEDGDLDGDGDVDLSDLAALLSVYGTSC
ncbi:MAG: hypothetical protein ACE5I3_07245 [Phycisphaerae bacterium]